MPTEQQQVKIPAELVPVFNDVLLESQAHAAAYAAGVQAALRIFAIRLSKQNPAPKENPADGTVQPE